MSRFSATLLVIGAILLCLGYLVARNAPAEEVMFAIVWVLGWFIMLLFLAALFASVRLR